MAASGRIDQSTSGSTPPVCVVCIGMAGSGKTTFMQRINAHLYEEHQKTPATTAPPYVMNLDPAVRSVPFESNVDIRDSVKYKEVMKQYNLGPNGAILTSLNLFATKIDQIINILEKRCLPQSSPPSTTPAPKHILIDTPGQIEVFVWSASGDILLSSIASSFPTVIAYIIDTPRTLENTSTFMSNMLYAISILYKTRLPMILVFNKTDVQSESLAVEWMRDFETFQAAVRAEEEQEREGSGYMGSLLNSMSLVLEEFYNALSVVGVSAMTGDGVDDFFAAVEEKREEFEREYRPEMERRMAQAEQAKEEVKQSQVRRMMKDMSVSSRAKGTGKYAKEEPETVSEAEDMDDEEDDDDYDELADEEEEQQQQQNDSGGLQARYANALKQSDGGTAPMAEYIRRTQQG